MYKLCLNSRDELIILDLQKIAYFQANGNYTQYTYIHDEKHLLSIGLAKVEDYIRHTWPMENASPFVRLGRSLIINQTFLREISVIKQRLVLSDCNGNIHTVSVPKALLRTYKDKINELYLRKLIE